MGQAIASITHAGRRSWQWCVVEFADDESTNVLAAGETRSRRSASTAADRALKRLAPTDTLPNTVDDTEFTRHRALIGWRWRVQVATPAVTDTGYQWHTMTGRAISARRARAYSVLAYHEWLDATGQR